MQKIENIGKSNEAKKVREEWKLNSLHGHIFMKKIQSIRKQNISALFDDVTMWIKLKRPKTGLYWRTYNHISQDVIHKYQRKSLLIPLTRVTKNGSNRRGV